MTEDVTKKPEEETKNVVAIIEKRLEKLHAMINDLPKNKKKFLKYIEQFKSEKFIGDDIECKEYYHFATHEEMLGGGNDAYYDFVIYPTYDIAIAFVKIGLKEKWMKDLLLYVLETGFSGHSYDSETISCMYMEKLHKAGIVFYMKTDADIRKAVELILDIHRKHVVSPQPYYFCSANEVKENSEKLLNLYKEIDKDILLFVYGTLMNGNENHEYLKGQKCISKNGIVKGFDLYDCDHFFPVAFRCEYCPDKKTKEEKNEHYINGELYRIDSTALESIRRIEEEFYREEWVEVFTDRRKAPHVAKMYVANPEKHKYWHFSENDRWKQGEKWGRHRMFEM